MYPGSTNKGLHTSSRALQMDDWWNLPSSDQGAWEEHTCVSLSSTGQVPQFLKCARAPLEVGASGPSFSGYQGVEPKEHTCASLEMGASASSLEPPGGGTMGG